MASFSVYIHVSGDPSDSEDEGFPGIYEVSIDSEDEINLDALTPSQINAIEEAALDAFHDKNGIEEIDDFTILVYLENGVLLDSPRDTVDNNVFSGYYFGKSNENTPDEVKKAVAFTSSIEKSMNNFGI